MLSIRTFGRRELCPAEIVLIQNAKESTFFGNKLKSIVLPNSSRTYMFLTHQEGSWHSIAHPEEVYFLFCANMINNFSFLSSVALRHSFSSEMLKGVWFV